MVAVELVRTAECAAGAAARWLVVDVAVPAPRVTEAGAASSVCSTGVLIVFIGG
jgi:hypothetical protein